MAGDDLAGAVDEDGDIEVERLDAACDLLDLRVLVQAGVLRVEGERLDGEVFDLEAGLGSDSDVLQLGYESVSLAVRSGAACRRPRPPSGHTDPVDETMGRRARTSS